MTDERPASTDDSQTPQAGAAEPEAPSDEQEADKKSAERPSDTPPRARVVLDHDP